LDDPELLKGCCAICQQTYSTPVLKGGETSWFGGRLQALKMC
jgi:hypothetical protein